MQVTATEAKNRFGQMLDACQTEPVIIEKSGRRHSVLLSMREYESLRDTSKDDNIGIRSAADPGKAFYAKYKDWVDAQRQDFDEYGLWSEGLVEWQSGMAEKASSAAERKVA